MPTDEEYTYRSGKKVFLNKSPEEFVVKLLPDELKDFGIEDAERVSSSTSRVLTRSTDLERTMSMMRYFVPTHHAYYVADTGKEFLITDRIFVTFREPLSSEQIDAFAGRYGLIKQAVYDDRLYLFQLTDHTGMNPVKLVVKLTEEEPMVESAEHDLNQRMRKYQLDLPNDPDYARQWHLHTKFSHSDFDPRSSTKCEDAWKLLKNYGSPDVVIGITDDGCKLDHPDFDSPGKFADWGYLRSTRLVTSRDISANMEEMYKPGADHGTCCAGVIAAEVDAGLTAGAAPGCRLLPIQWESRGSEVFISDSKLLTVLDFIKDKVDILSNSWGDSPDQLFIADIPRKIKELARTGGRRGLGIVFIWAAGNNNCPIQHTASVEVPYTDGVNLRPDGSLVWVGVQTDTKFSNNLVGIPGVMHIAAVSSKAQRSHYSNYGTGIDICAPSNNGHAYYRASVDGIGIVTTSGLMGGITEEFGGTSSAAPLVAGIAALVISANPELTAYEVVSILKKTASKDLSLVGYPRTPPASFDPDTSWDVSPIEPFDRGDFVDKGYPEGTWSPWFGHGRVDAASAVAEALKGRVTPDQGLRRDSAPNLEIPDNTQEGIQNTINFEEVGIVSSITVTIDLTHTYIGDLRLTLISPSGVSVVLHDRNGGRSNDIKRSFDQTSNPGLSAFVGQPVQGNWMLQVQDLAPMDKGQINRWELEIEMKSNGMVNLEESPGVDVPDNNPSGIERKLTTAETGQVKDVEVYVDITHAFISDLIVELTSPTGTTVPLHQRIGGSADNIIKTYTSADTPNLRTLKGQPVKGNWRLKVADVEGSDVGKLNKWGLKIMLAP